MLTEIRLRPWWRAPLLLFRRRGVVVALTAAAFVATVPAASAPLFLSSAQSASIARQVEAVPPAYSGVRVAGAIGFRPADEVYTEPDGFVVSGPSIAAARAEHAERAADPVPNLGPMRVSYVAGASFAGPDAGDGVQVTRAGGGPEAPARNMVLLAREGFAGEVDVVEGGSGDGVWLPDAVAADLAVSAGDRIVLGAHGESVELPVAAVHRDLRRGNLSPFWSSVRTVVRTPDRQRAFPAALLVNAGTYHKVAATLDLHTEHMVEFPLVDTTPSRELAGTTADALPAMRADLFSREAEDYYRQGVREMFSSELPRFVERSDLVESTLRVPVGAASVAGAAVGLLVVGAAALLWTRRRHRELVALAAHGAGPGPLGVKGALEALPAVLLGSVAGWLVGYGLTVTVGPSPVLAGRAVPISVWLAVAAGLVCLAVVGGAAAARCRALTDAVVPGRARRLLAAAPWELGLLAAAAAAWLWLDRDTVVAGDPEGQVGAVVRLPPAVFVTPVLASIGGVILAARVGRWWLRRRALAAPPSGHAVFLAWRRVGRDRAVSLALVAATAVPVALAGYGAVVARSAETTLAARAETFVGADVVIDLSEPEPAPPSVTDLGRVTEVVRLDGFQLGTASTSLLLVDTGTFPRMAEVGDLLVDGSFAAALEDLRGTGPPARILATPTAPSGLTDLTFREDQIAMPVRVTTVPELPARRSGFPVAVAPRALLPDRELPLTTRHQLWVSGDDPEAIVAAAQRDLATVERIRLAQEQYQGTLVEPVTYTFAYLVAVSVLTAVVVVVGLLLHLESRSVAHRRAYVLLRRMGMRPRTHRAALLWELGGLLVAGAALGVAATAALGYALSPAFDPRPDYLPGTVLTVPGAPFVVIAVAVLATAVGAALFAHARAARADAGEVLREVA